MRKGLVSIMVPAYNSGKFINRTILSALNQTYRDIEVIIVNDGSSDDTALLVSELVKRDSRIRYYFQENRGLSYTRNRLFDLAFGEYAAFLDHDDEWYPEKLELQLELFKIRPRAALIFSDMLNVCADATKESFRYFSRRKPHRGKVFYDFLIEGNFVPLSSVVVKTEIAKKYLPFNSDFKIAEEWELFLRLSKEFDFDYIDKPLGVYNLHADRASNDVLLEINECIRIMDYWHKTDIELTIRYRRKFLKARSELNLRKAYFYKQNNNIKHGIKEIVNSICIYPWKISFYLRLIKYFFLLGRKNND